MSKQAANERPAAGLSDQDLLGALLASEVPSRQGQIRPARMRSTREQQQIALRGFLLRNWVDRTLALAERGLVLAAVVAFGFWLLDGPVRDWIHAYQETRIVWAGPQETATPAISVPAAVSSPPAPAAPQAAAAAPLPFTRPDDGAIPPASAGAAASRDEFLVPQVAPGAQSLDDPRPRRLQMPSIGADMDVHEVRVVNGEWEVAEYAAGFHDGTALPGNIGNSVFSGHAGLRGAVFKDLGRLQPGDEVVVETARWRYVYRVRSSQNVWPTQVEVMDQTPTPTLTLITCTNWDTQRLVVVADLVDARPLS
jgi:sortase A